MLQRVRPPAEASIRAPEFPPQSDWLNGPPLRMTKLIGRGATLVEFFDVARINSHRTLPYLLGWHARYADAGLRVVGIHCPGYSLGVERAVVEPEVERMGIEYPVLLDPGFYAWRAYGNQGWPGRYLFGVDGILRWMHYGEGEYAAAERAIQEALLEIDPGLDLPEPLEPVRPEDADGVLLTPQTADVALPGGRERLDLTGDWTAGEDYLEATATGAQARVRSFTAGAAYAVLGGAIERSGLHETDGTVTAEAPGLRLYGFQFTPSLG